MVDGVVSIIVLIIFGVVIGFLMNQQPAKDTQGNPVNPLLNGLSNLWGKALNYMYGR